MKKQVLYNYLGTNGMIISPVHLEDTYYIRKFCLIAEENKQLTKNGVDFFTSITIPEDELSEWYEVDIENGQE